MKKIYAPFLFVLSLFFLVFSCSKAAEITPQTPHEIIEATQLLNVSYGEDSAQVYDIYLPANRNENTKVIILIHGGGWISGDKVDMNSIKDIVLADLQDYAVVNMNYRLASQGVSPFPMQLNDITTVINDLKAKQNTYKISQDFGFIGTSAGAHLALLWSYDYNAENNIKMVASIVGPTNLADPAYTDNPELQIPELMLYFGVTPTTGFLESVSPLHQATTTSPPTILFYGGMDPLVPNSQGIAMDTKLTTLGVPHQFTFYPNEGHGWIGAPLLDTWGKLKAFINTHL